MKAVEICFNKVLSLTYVIRLVEMFSSPLHCSSIQCYSISNGVQSKRIICITVNIIYCIEEWLKCK